MAQIREVLNQDFDQIWKFFQPIVVKGETYPYPRNTSKEEAFRLWIKEAQKTYVCVENNEILATYYLKQNQVGQGSHVCNCGYMVSAEARGKGLGTLMCEHSQKIARKLNYKAMQFNLVVVSNVQAVNLWSKLGFETAGKITKGFQHPTLGFVDALVMYKWL